MKPKKKKVVDSKWVDPFEMPKEEEQKEEQEEEQEERHSIPGPIHPGEDVTMWDDKFISDRDLHDEFDWTSQPLF